METFMHLCVAGRRIPLPPEEEKCGERTSGSQTQGARFILSH